MFKKLIDSSKIYQIIGFLLGIFVFLPNKIKPYLVVLLVLLSFSSEFSKSNIKRAFLNTAPIALVYFLYLISLFNTSNIPAGISLIGRMVPLLLVPLSLYLIKAVNKAILVEVFKKVFPVALAGYVVLLLAYLNHLGCFTGDSSFEYGYSFVTHEFFGINDHPIYISTYFSIGLLLLLTTPYKSRLFSIFLFALIFAGLLVLSRKGSIIAFVLCGIFYFVNNRRNFFRAGVLFIVALGALFLVPNVRHRFEEVITKNKIDRNPETSSGVRIIVWETALRKAFDTKNFFGYGAGDVQDILNEEYVNQDFDRLTDANHNAHNQFFQVAITTGIFGLLIFVAGLSYLVYRQIVLQNRTGLLLICFFLLIFLTESYLERQNGVIFFALIISMFTFVHHEKKCSNNRSVSATDIGS